MDLMTFFRRFVPVIRPLPASVYAVLVTEWQEPPGRIERLRCVRTKGRVGGHTVDLIRIIDPEAIRQRGVAVGRYADLDAHPELVVYQGWFAPGAGAQLQRGSAGPGV